MQAYLIKEEGNSEWKKDKAHNTNLLLFSAVLADKARWNVTKVRKHTPIKITVGQHIC